MKKQIESLEAALEKQEQYSRRQCLRVYGIPESPQENTDQAILDLAAKMGVNLDSRDIDRSHRITPKRQVTQSENQQPHSKPKAIIVKFARYNARNMMYAAKSRLKNTGIVIREDLTPERQGLYFKTLHHENTTRTWSIDGKIFTMTTDGRKKVITSIRDIERL